MTTPSNRAARDRSVRNKYLYMVYQSTEYNRTLMWLTIQHVGLTVAGHQTSDTTVHQTSEAATYLVPVTIVAAVNWFPDHDAGDFAAYIGVAPPHYTNDPDRVEYISRHGNKIERALAEHLFRQRLNARFGKDKVYHRD